MHEKVAKLVIERATVIFNLLAGGPAGPVKDTMYWPVLARRSEKCAGPASGPVLMLRAEKNVASVCFFFTG